MIPEGPGCQVETPQVTNRHKTQVTHGQAAPLSWGDLQGAGRPHLQAVSTTCSQSLHWQLILATCTWSPARAPVCPAGSHGVCGQVGTRSLGSLTSSGCCLEPQNWSRQHEEEGQRAGGERGGTAALGKDQQPEAGVAPVPPDRLHSQQRTCRSTQGLDSGPEAGHPLCRAPPHRQSTS